MHKWISILIFGVISFFCCHRYTGQVINLNDFDDKSFHFGFALSFNNSSYYLNQPSFFIFIVVLIFNK